MIFKLVHPEFSCKLEFGHSVKEDSIVCLTVLYPKACVLVQEGHPVKEDSIV